DLGRFAVPTALRAAGAIVEAHADHFAQDASDDEWLAAVGTRGWIVITKDTAIRHRGTELLANQDALSRPETARSVSEEASATVLTLRIMHDSREMLGKSRKLRGFDGRRSRDRTCDLSLVRAALSRLSYPPMPGFSRTCGAGSIRQIDEPARARTR